MKTIDMPTHAVVTVTGGRRDPIAETAAMIDATAVPWDVNKPDDALERLHAVLTEHGRARVAMPNGHAKARRDVATAARRHGAISIVLRLPGSTPVQEDEKHAAVHDVTGPADFVVRDVPMPFDLRHLTGPFDMIGDVHGAADELMDLLEKLGHAVDGVVVRHPKGRIPVLLGDLTDRGPQNLRTLRIAQELEAVGGLRVIGNHDDKLARALAGKKVRVAAGLSMTLAETDLLPEEERAALGAWVASAEPHLVLDGGRLIVAHAGLAEEHHGRATNGARAFALYGKPAGDGSLDDEGFPKAIDWALDYAGEATVVQGHVVYAEPRIVGDHKVVNVDTGAVFGGRLTAYRWPERTFESVPARATYFKPRAFLQPDAVPAT